MAWFPVSDNAHSHPKMRKAGLAAVGLWSMSGSWNMDTLNDGFVPEWFVKQFPRGVQLAKRLVEAGLWKTARRNGDNGWLFHDWKPECTKQRVEKLREEARLRKQKSRESRRDSDGEVTVSVTRDMARDSRMPSHECLVPDQTRPDQTINTSLVTSRGSVTKVDAREEPPPCRKHPNGTDRPCGACGARRRWEQDREAAARADELQARRQARERAENCPHCHGTNHIEIDDNTVRKCHHAYEAADA